MASILENYYSVNGRSKRFFYRESVVNLFTSGCRVLSMEERSVHQCEHPKALWEVVLKSDACCVSVEGESPSGG